MPHNQRQYVGPYGSPAEFRYGVDGNDDGHTSVYDPADPIPAARRALPGRLRRADDYHAALFGHNHAEWYVAEVLAKATEYRGSATAAGDTPEFDSGVLSDVLHNPRITLTPIQQSRPALRRDPPPPHRHARVHRPPPLRRHHRTEVRPLPLHRRRVEGPAQVRAPT